MSRDFEGRACPKIHCSFPAMNRFRNLDFLWFPAIFWGPKKFSKRGFFRDFLGFWRMGTSKFFWNLDPSAVFLGFWSDRPTQKLVNPQTCQPFSCDFEGMDPPKKLSHQTANPATVRCKKHSQIASWDLSILDSFFYSPNPPCIYWYMVGVYAIVPCQKFIHPCCTATVKYTQALANVCYQLRNPTPLTEIARTPALSLFPRPSICLYETVRSLDTQMAAFILASSSALNQACSFLVLNRASSSIIRGARSNQLGMSKKKSRSLVNGSWMDPLSWRRFLILCDRMDMIPTLYTAKTPTTMWTLGSLQLIIQSMCPARSVIGTYPHHL